MYDHYVSLGANCEVAFQFRRVLGKDSASFFSWNVTKIGPLQRILENQFTGMLQPQNIKKFSVGLSIDAAYDYQFHSAFSGGDPANDEQFEEKAKTYKERADYLIGKFLENAQSEGQTAYFYKVVESLGREHFIPIRDALAKIHRKNNFKLLIVKEESKKEAPWNEDGLENVYVKRFASWDDATDGHVSSWDKIFRQFPHKEKMYFSGY